MHISLRIAALAVVTMTTACDYRADGSPATVAGPENPKSGISPVMNVPPQAQNASFTANEDDAVTGQLQASDGNGNPITYRLFAQSANGIAEVRADGSFTYTPAPNINGSDRFTFVANDGQTDGNVATVSITVTAVNDAPQAMDDGAMGNEDTPIVVRALANDVDADSALDPASVNVRSVSNGMITINRNTGEITFMPDANYFGPATITYTVSDVEGLVSNVATIGLFIEAVNDAPTAQAATVTGDEDTVISGQLSGADVEASTLTFALATGPSNGRVVVNANGSYSYTPNANYFGSDSFTFTSNDGALSSSLATVSITVRDVAETAGNDAPVAASASATTPKNTVLNGQLTASDGDGDSLSYSVVGAATNGSVVVTANGSYTFTPANNFVGSASFTFKVNDGTVDSAPATVSITVIDVAEPPPPRAGVSRDVVLVSAVDGEDISITVHEPRLFQEGKQYPLVLDSHGYGGSKVAASARPAAGNTGTLGRLLDAGYGSISIDQRGFGASGGTVRLLDPDFEGKDLIQILDWAEANLPWLAYRDNNLLLGAIGGSYGGGYQHTIYALDPKHRLDAIVPEITWNDLRYSLFSGRVFKTYWATLLSGVGNASGRQDPQINQGLAEGLATNNLSQTNLDLLYRVSLASHCAGQNTSTAGGALQKVDAMYWQSARDTLFNLNDAAANYRCLKALGGDVRLLTKINGHDSGTGERCGNVDKSKAIVDWYDEKLKGITNKASYIPKVCFNLGESGTDAVVTTTLPEGGSSYQVPAQMINPANNSPQPATSVLLVRVTDGMVLAGIPTASLVVADAVPGAPRAGDPIVFLGLAVRKAGTTTDTLVMANQVRPIRGYGTFDVELIGLNVRLAANDEVRLLIYPAFTGRYPNSGSTAPAPVSISGSVQLPLLSKDLPAPPSN